MNPRSRWISESLKLNNKHLENIDNIIDAANKVLSYSLMFTWLGLSCNSLTNISDVRNFSYVVINKSWTFHKLLSFINLKIIYTGIKSQIWVKRINWIHFLCFWSCLCTGILLRMKRYDVCILNSTNGFNVCLCMVLAFIDEFRGR